MKITAVDSTVLAVPTPQPMALEFREHRLVVAHVRTDEGLSGLGYSLAFGGGGPAIQVYWRPPGPFSAARTRGSSGSGAMYRRRHPAAGRRVRAAALDIALWDLVGKAAGQPSTGSGAASPTASQPTGAVAGRRTASRTSSRRRSATPPRASGTTSSRSITPTRARTGGASRRCAGRWATASGSWST
jgi:hypothetical protein